MGIILLSIPRHTHIHTLYNFLATVKPFKKVDVAHFYYIFMVLNPLCIWVSFRFLILALI